MGLTEGAFSVLHLFLHKLLVFIFPQPSMRCSHLQCSARTPPFHSSVIASLLLLPKPKVKMANGNKLFILFIFFRTYTKHEEDIFMEVSIIISLSSACITMSSYWIITSSMSSQEWHMHHLAFIHTEFSLHFIFLSFSLTGSFCLFFSQLVFILDQHIKYLAIKNKLITTLLTSFSKILIH